LRKRVLSRIVWLAAFLAVASPSATATTFHVDATGYGDFRKIQEAIDVSSDGDLILVGPGIYAGELNRDLDFDGREITVRSITGPEDTIIHCQNQGHAFTFHEYEDTLSVVQGFTITRTQGEAIRCGRGSPKIVDIVVDELDDNGSGIWCYNSDAVIANCVFAVTGTGIYCGGSNSDLKIRDCVIRDCGGYGVDIALSARAIITGTTLFGNNGGVRCREGTDVVLSRCLLTFSTTHSGLVRSMPNLMEVSCTDIYGNVGGDWTEYTSGWLGIQGNICEDPLFVDPGNRDLHLSPSSPCAPYSPPNEACDLIGALEVAYPPAVERTSWGLIKAMFR